MRIVLWVYSPLPSHKILLSFLTHICFIHPPLHPSPHPKKSFGVFFWLTHFPFNYLLCSVILKLLIFIFFHLKFYVLFAGSKRQGNWLLNKFDPLALAYARLWRSGQKIYLIASFPISFSLNFLFVTVYFLIIRTKIKR